MNKSTKRKSSPTKDKQSSIPLLVEFFKEKRTRITLGITLTLTSIYMLAAMIGCFFSGGIDQSLIDSSSFGQIISNPQIMANNPTGKIGAWIADLFINHWFGLPSFILCYLLILCSFRIAGAKIKQFNKKIFIGMMIVLWTSLLLGFITESIYKLFDVGTGYLFPGGGHGYFLSLWLNALIGRVGTILFLVLTFSIILFFGFEQTFYRWVNYIKENIRKRKEKALAALLAQKEGQQTEKIQEELEPIMANEETQEDEEDENQQTDFSYPDFPEQEAITFDIEEEKTDDNKDSQDNEDHENSEESDKGLELEIKTTPASSIDFEISDHSDESIQIEAEKDEADKNEDLQLTISNPDSEETIDHNISPTEDYDPTLELSNYQYPTLDLLEEHSSGNPKVTQEELEENKNKIVNTLLNYKIEIIKIKATIGPTVTLYEIIPAPGVKISKIKNLEDDIALSLAALGIRIIAPIPGAGTIGIEVPNQNPEVVSMRGIIASKKFQESNFALPIALGRTISNETYTIDLAKMPHLLEAGATGQGKSVGLNAIITSLLYKKHPSQLKFVMVDPKKVELSIYSIIEKHFLAKLPDEEDAIITETSKVVNTLNSLCIEMDSRYDLLKIAQVRNIKEYNEKFIKRKLNPNNGHKFLPYIVVIVDEFADLIMTAGKEVETPIARIAQLARAVGIHMIIATQRPSTNIITGIIKANFPARIAFKVASMIDSRTILDSPGANQLIGRGDMLISVNSEMTRVQCAFVDTPEVDAITHFIAKQQSYPDVFALPEYVPEGEGNGLADIDLSTRDALFEDAARLIVRSQQGSTSSIQRRFSIGYNRAGKIIDQLEATGIVGPFEGSKARQVLVQDEYALEQILNAKF